MSAVPIIEFDDVLTDSPAFRAAIGAHEADVDAFHAWLKVKLRNNKHLLETQMHAGRCCGAHLAVELRARHPGRHRCGAQSVSFVTAPRSPCGAELTKLHSAVGKTMAEFSVARFGDDDLSKSELHIGRDDGGGCGAESSAVQCAAELQRRADEVEAMRAHQVPV